MPFRIGSKLLFSVRPNLSATIFATITPIAGADESPGDSIPAALKNRSASLASPMTKSSPASCALRPAKEVIT